ncbi:MAG: TolC family protein [Bacteroidota bacterium]
MGALKKSLQSLVLLSLSFSLLQAQEGEWTLQNCIDYALDHNIGVKRQELNTQLSQKDLVQSKMNVLPDLNGAIEHQLGSGRVLDRGTYEWYNTTVSQGDMGVQSTFSLFNGLQGLNSIQMEKANYMKSQADLETFRDNITLQVMTGYLEVLRKSELEDIAAKKVEVVALQVERIQRMADLGTVSPGELLTVRSQYSNEKLNLTRARNDVRTARLTLIQLMNLPLSDTFDIVHPDLQTPDELLVPGLNEVYATALTELPSIKSAEYYVEARKKNLAVQQGKRSPSLYVRGLYYTNYSNKLPNPIDGTYDYPLFSQITDNQYRQVSVGVSFPFFNRWQTQTSISKARITYQDADYMLQNEKQNTLKEIQQYYTEALAARDNYLAAVELVTSSEEAFNYAEEKYKVGLANALELEEARNKLFESRSQMVTSRYVFIFYTKILDYYQGREITL